MGRVKGADRQTDKCDKKTPTVNCLKLIVRGILRVYHNLQLIFISARIMLEDL